MRNTLHLSSFITMLIPLSHYYASPGKPGDYSRFAGYKKCYEQLFYNFWSSSNFKKMFVMRYGDF